MRQNKRNSNSSSVVIMHRKEEILRLTSIACIIPHACSVAACRRRFWWGAVKEILIMVWLLSVVRKERKIAITLPIVRSVYLLRRCADAVVEGLRPIQPAPALRPPQRQTFNVTITAASGTGRPRAPTNRTRPSHSPVSLPGAPPQRFVVDIPLEVLAVCRLSSIPSLGDTQPRSAEVRYCL